MGGLFLLTAYSQVKLQTWEKKSTLKSARDSNRYDLTYRDLARRGGIFSSDGKPLAQDDESYALTINFDKIPHSDAFFMELSEATGLPASDFAALAETPKESKTWLDPVAGSRYKAVMALKKRWRADGLSLKLTGERTYPLGDAASCMVGVIREYKERDLDPKLVTTMDKVLGVDASSFIQLLVNNRDGRVYTGLERSMNKNLSGTDGVKVGLTDRNGAFLPMRMEEGSIPKSDGKDVVLTIDSDLQTFATESLRKAVEVNKAENGVALVMNPKTGELLAMANWPSFDPNANAGKQGKFGFNPAYMAQLEPGSTFKILTLAKGLDVGKVNMNDSINCEGEWHPTPKSRIRCDSHHGNRAHGTVTAERAIAKSCNVSAAIWASRVGREDFLDYIRKLGITKRSKLQIPGELHGGLDYADPAHQLQLALFGFGQAITCTPVGLIGAFGMLGNNGIRVEPRILSRIGNEIQKTEPGTPIVKPETAQKVMDCMTAVIESDEGTGAKLRIPGYKLAGKTGTAEKVGKGEKGYVSNFVGFVPAKDPKAVILVMINHPQNGAYYGAAVAGPVFQQIAKAVIRHYAIPPTEPIVAPSKASKSTKQMAELID